MRAPLPDGSPAPPLTKHADDAYLVLTGLEDARRVMREEQGPWRLHERASGAREATDKLMGLLLGPEQGLIDPTTRTCAHTGIKFVQEPFRHLGIYQGLDGKEAAARTAGALLSRVQAAAAHWSRHRLSYIGRAYVAKQVLAATLVYFVGFVAMPPHVWSCIRGVLARFLAGAAAAGGGLDGGLRHPAQRVAALPWEEGGIALVDIDVHADCLRAKVVARLLHPARHPWKTLMAANLRAAVPALGPALAVRGLRASARVLPPRLAAFVQAFQRTMPHRLIAPAELSPHQVGSEPLFHNRQILLQGTQLRPAQHRGLIDAGILTVRDLAAAVQQPEPPPEAQAAWACLPAAWQRAATAPTPPEWELAQTLAHV